MGLLGQLLRRAIPAPPPPEPPASAAPRTEAGRVVRLITYNVHGCVGLDGKRSAERIAEALAPFEPDVVALQELDVQRMRSGREDQPAIIARTLRMEAHFAPAFTVGDERYGNALLSRHPLRLRHTGPLPARGQSEPRGAMWATLELGGRTLHILNTHLGLHPAERAAQAATLLGERWVSHPDFAGPAVLCGDLNAMPGSGAYRALTGRLLDAQALAPERRPQRTFPSRWPAFRIDHILIHPALRVAEARALLSPVTRVASDHLPLLATLVLPS